MYNYIFGKLEKDEEKIDLEELLILKKSININNMNKLCIDSYKVSLN
jgi:hypothetical protein